jgi:hypothetical protein
MAKQNFVINCERTAVGVWSGLIRLRIETNVVLLSNANEHSDSSKCWAFLGRIYLRYRSIY